MMRSLGTPAFHAMRIFVCHASEDRTAVGRLCGALAVEGIESWFDVESLKPGDDWELKIRKAIRRSQAVLVCLSPRAIEKRTFLQREIHLVLEATAAQPRPASFPFPVLLEHCRIPRRLAKWQAVDLSDSNGFSVLLDALRTVASSTPGIAVPGDHATEANWTPPLIRDKLPDIVQSTRSYERWLRSLTPVISKNSSSKHERMAISPVAFFRGTFYRWAEAWPADCPTLATAPIVLSAGNIELFSFRTWLDPEGRLGWGITSLDEAYPLPYPCDLVRFVTGIALETRALNAKLPGGLKGTCEEVLTTYSAVLQRGGEPFVLGTRHKWLYRLFRTQMRLPAQYWRKFEYPRFKPMRNPSIEVHEALERALPLDVTFRVLKPRSIGVVSADWPRYFAVAQWKGGHVGAEARYIPLPAAAWAAGLIKDVPTFHNRILETARRTPDLRSGVWKGVVVRRIGPEVGSGLLVNPMSTQKISRKMIKACAKEIANVHAGTPGSQSRVLDHLKTLPPGWLEQATKIMLRRNEADYAQWCLSRNSLDRRSRSSLRDSTQTN